MKDLIEERDRKQKIQRSIIKFWNVHYLTQDEMADRQRRKREADEIYARLLAEEAEDEAKRQAEIEAAIRERDGYNSTTKSFSGGYGRGNVDSVTKGQIEQILGEKEAKIRSMFEENSAEPEEVLIAEESMVEDITEESGEEAQ